MPYWGSGPIDNDYAFDAIGVYVLLIKERMFDGANKVIEKSYPEQAIIASLQCVRLLAGPFRKSVRVSFDDDDFERAKVAFRAWFHAVENKLPTEYRDAILSEAEREFELFEAQVINSI